MTDIETILFSEQVMIGSGHARSNASLMIAARHAFPSARCLLYATQRHYDSLVTSADPEHGATIQSVAHVPWCDEEKPAWQTSAPRSRLAGYARRISSWARSVRRTLNVAAEAKKVGADLVIHLSGDGNVVQQAKLAAQFLRCTTPAIFIGHNHHKKSESCRYKLLTPSLMTARQIHSPLPCRYGLLFEGMRAYIQAHYDAPHMEDFFELNYPVVWGSRSAARGRARPEGKPVRIAYLSPSHKGVDDFCEFARKFHERARHEPLAMAYEFTVVGGFTRRTHKEVASKLESSGVTAFPRDYLTEEQYSNELLSADYIIQLYQPDTYDARFSSAVFDAIAWRIPGFYIATGYVRYLFDEIGKPGWMVQDIDSAISAVCEVLNAFDVESYRRQVGLVDACRTHFTVERTARQLRQIVSSFPMAGADQRRRTATSL